jgi:hypothetical protein
MHIYYKINFLSIYKGLSSPDAGFVSSMLCKYQGTVVRQNAAKWMSVSGPIWRTELVIEWPMLN